MLSSDKNHYIKLNDLGPIYQIMVYLRHPHILEATDASKDGQIILRTQGYALTLSQYLQQYSLKNGETSYITAGIISAYHYLLQNGWKTELTLNNILINEKGEIKLGLFKNIQPVSRNALEQADLDLLSKLFETLSKYIPPDYRDLDIIAILFNALQANMSLPKAYIKSGICDTANLLSFSSKNSSILPNYADISNQTDKALTKNLLDKNFSKKQKSINRVLFFAKQISSVRDALLKIADILEGQIQRLENKCKDNALGLPSFKKKGKGPIIAATAVVCIGAIFAVFGW